MIYILIHHSNKINTIEKTWRHLNFFQHEFYLNCRVPRVKPEDNKIRQIDVPWAGKSNGFTLLFEVLLMQLCCEMPVNAVFRLTNADDNKVWRMLQCYVEEARKHEDFSKTIKESTMIMLRCLLISNSAKQSM